MSRIKSRYVAMVVLNWDADVYEVEDDGPV